MNINNINGLLYLTGGKAKVSAQFKNEWEQFAAGVVLAIDASTGSVQKKVEFVSESKNIADGGSILFKSGTLCGRGLFTCTQTEVVIFDLDTLQKKTIISLPSFNDLHHVLPMNDQELLVVNTGLDRVQKIDYMGRIIKEWSVINEDLGSGRFNRDVDYRKVLSTKPHLSHPNFSFSMDGEYWVTRFEQRDAICLTKSQPEISIGVERPHDGVVTDEHVVFTTVDGRLVFVSRGKADSKIIDLNELYKVNQPLGWCRGLYITGDIAWVGFSRIRPTKLMSNLSWIKHGFKSVGIYNTLPTRLACIDLRNMKVVSEINLEPLGMNAVFGVMGANE